MYGMWFLRKCMTPRDSVSEVPGTHAYLISDQVEFSLYREAYFLKVIRSLSHYFKLNIENNSAVLFIAQSLMELNPAFQFIKIT